MLFVQSAVCCFQYIYMRTRQKQSSTKKKIEEKRNKQKGKKKYRARDKSNRNVENNTQCSEFCLWEAKIVDVSLQIHNKTEANHALTLRYAIAIVPTNRFYYYQLEFLLGLFILFITFSWMRTHDVCPLYFTITVDFIFASSICILAAKSNRHEKY